VQAGSEFGTVWVPRKRNEMDIDAIWLDEDGRGILFQMTIRQGHKLQGSPIKESIRHLDMNSAQLRFVTPKSIALNFDRQTISTGNKEEYKRKRNEPQIEQNAALIDPSSNDKYIS
jgi:hypothetical protein